MCVVAVSFCCVCVSIKNRVLILNLILFSSKRGGAKKSKRGNSHLPENNLFWSVIQIVLLCLRCEILIISETLKYQPKLFEVFFNLGCTTSLYFQQTN